MPADAPDPSAPTDPADHPAPTVAVIGGGQLARMLAEPAAAMGIPLRLLAEGPGVSAAQVIPDHTVGELAKNIQVAVVPGGLLDHVDQDPTQGRSPLNIRNTTGEIGQFEFGDDLPGTSTLSFVFIEEFTDGLRLTHPPLGVGVLP